MTDRDARDGVDFSLGDHFIMGNQTNNPQSGHGNDQKSNQRNRDDDMSKRGGGMGKDQDQKQRNDQSGSHSGSDRNRQGSQNR
jgi:hypothetical protein